MSITTPKDLTRWIEDAQYALDHAKGLTIDQLRAIVATPDQTGRDGLSRRTWWSDEATQVAKAAARDRFPNNGDEAAVRAWQERQTYATEQIESLTDAHAECLARAGAFLAASPRTTKKRRRTAADDALSHAIPDAA